MSKAEKIKAEIERLKNELIQEVEKGYKSEFDEGRISAFEDMMVYINSLEEETTDSDLEDEITRCIVDEDMNFSDVAHHFAQWKEKQLTKNSISMDIDSETEWDDIHKFLRKNLDGEKVKLIIINCQD